MQTTKITCPLCQGVFMVGSASPVGKKLRCQKCGARFTVVVGDLCGLLDPAPVPKAPAQVDVPAAAASWWVEGQDQVAPAASAAAAPLAAQPALPVGAAAITPRPGIPYSRPAPKPARAAVANAAEPGRARVIALCAVFAGLTLVVGVGAAVAVVKLSSDPEPPVVAAAPESKASPAPKKKPLPVQQGDSLKLEPKLPPLDAVQPKIGDQPADPAAPKGNELPKEPSPKPINPKPRPVVLDRFGISQEQHKQIDFAISRGVKFVENAQFKEGYFEIDPKGPNFHRLGATSLAALTLLACDVAPTDPHIVKAANLIRRLWLDNRQTYELALTLLFLDKLGDKNDKPIIVAMALRLIKGQNQNGGWSYTCPLLTNLEATQLLAYLQKNRPKPAPAIIQKPSGGPLPTPIDKADKNPLQLPVDKGDKNPFNPSQQPGNAPKSQVPDGPKADGKSGEELDDDESMLISLPQVKGPKKDFQAKLLGGIDDNSNTQFALLALWAARRHDVPVENVLGLAERRFRTSQNNNGGWGYTVGGPSKPSMTCVGLLGIALGKGSTAETANRGAKRGDPKAVKPVALDDQIRKGLNAVRLQDHHIDGQNFHAAGGLYFVWSVERIGVLYDLTKIGDTYWYKWGVDMLVPHQREDGTWQTYSYPGSNPLHDTCFALLFLKRANFVQDLTDLNLFLPIQDPSEMRPKNP